MQLFDLGDVLPFSVRLYDAPDGELVNASSVALTITRPDGTTTAPSVTNPPDEQGIYQVDHVSTQAGRYLGRWVFTMSGGATEAFTETFDVRESAPVALCSLAGAKRHLNMTATVDDDELRGHIDAASVLVEQHLRTSVARRTRTARVCGGDLLPYPPVLSVTSATTVPAETDVDVSDWLPDPVTGLVQVPITVGVVDVVYVVGVQVVQPNIILATEIVAAHLWETQRIPRTGPSRGPLGGADDSLTMIGMGYAMPNRALQLLGGPAPLVG